MKKLRFTLLSYKTCNDLCNLTLVSCSLLYQHPSVWDSKVRPKAVCWSFSSIPLCLSRCQQAFSVCFLPREFWRREALEEMVMPGWSWHGKLKGSHQIKLVWSVCSVCGSHVWTLVHGQHKAPSLIQREIYAPTDDKSSHIIKDKVLGQDGTVPLGECIISVGFIWSVCHISFPRNCLANSLCPSTPFPP